MRRSIAGPLFIILVGSLLLAQNMVADFSIWKLFAQHWPWLLVGWGGFRLVEHGLAAARGESGPPPMRAGALILAALLCSVGATAHAVQGADWTSRARALWNELGVFEPAHQVKIKGSWPAADIRTLAIDGYLGDITIAGDDESSIRISGHRSIVADSIEAARRTSDTAPPVFEITGESATLGPSGAAKRRFSGDLLVRAPRSLALTVTQGDGAIEIRDFDSTATIESAGRVEVERVAGPVTVALRRGRNVEAREIAGDFRLDGASRRVALKRIGGRAVLGGESFGMLDISSTGPFELSSNRLTVKAPGGLPGRLEAKTGSVEIEGVEGGLDLTASGRWKVQASEFGAPSRLIGQRGRIEAAVDAQRLGDLEIQLESGDITLALPADADYSLEAAGTVVESSLPERRATADGSLSLRSGSGEPALQLKTGRGRIRLETLDSSR